jgi:GntR family transcriptional regulator / MocR family aminotransferase
MKTVISTALIQIDRSNQLPIYQQIANSLRNAIMDGTITPGTKIPSNRDLAEMLGVSRNTSVNALDILISEGYIETKVGAGSFVSDELPEEFLYSSSSNKTDGIIDHSQDPLSRRGEKFVKGYNPAWHLGERHDHNLFRNGRPDCESFPFSIWEKISRKYLFYDKKKIFDFPPDPAGYEPLRSALGEYLSTARAVNCKNSKVIIISATEKLVYLAAKLLTEAGDKVWVQEPGFPGAVRAFRAAENVVVPVPVDNEGMNVEKVMETGPDAKMVYVQPSHEFPIGSTLSLKRRMALLSWAKKNGSWIIEDDYDSEYRYYQRPLPALQGLDQNNRVIYCGSFNLTLFPGIRLDYAVVPEVLYDAFIDATTTIDIHLPTQNQVIAADFISEGHFARHIRRMRKFYKERRNVLINALEIQKNSRIHIGPSDCGINVCIFLNDGLNDENVSLEAKKRGIEVLPLSRFYYGEEKRNGLVLGFSACQQDDTEWGVSELMKIINSQ